MRILRFRVSKAHGYLNLDIRFNPELTLLTGINGSGKTTAVRGMMALLTPSFRELATLQYERMAVDFNHEDKELQIEARRTTDDFTLTCGPASVTVPIYRPIHFEPAYKYFERQTEFYREQHTLLGKKPALEEIAKIPTPMFLGLERRGAGGSAIRRPRFADVGEPPSELVPPQGWLSEGLREAQEVAEEANWKVLNARQALTDDLRKGLLLMSFASEQEPETTKLPDLTALEELSDNYETVTDVLRSLGIQETDISEFVDPFFTRLSSVVAEVSSLDAGKVQAQDKETMRILSRYFAMRPQERHIQRVVKRAEQYRKQVKEEMRPIENYLAAVNQFLVHSGKQLIFGKNGRLQIARKGGSVGVLSALSSGERQLVVILTHLSFSARAKAANVLIIDEPELSLHIKWQEMFIDALRAANREIQMIFATHSPSIIMTRVEECVDLNESRA